MISNAEAGSSERDNVDAAVSVLEKSGLTVEVVATRGIDDLKSALDERQDRDIVIAGGDGSLHVVVAELYRRGELDQPVLGLVPLGTGNDFARGVGLPLESADAAQVFVSGRETRVDILVDDAGEPLINAVHCGAGADAGREAVSWKPRLGKLAYVVGALKTAVTTQGHQLRVTADDVVLADGSRRVLQVAVGNGPFVGGGTGLTPDADPTDGLADVLVSFAVGRLDRFLYAVHLRRGTHDERHDVQTARAREVTISGEGFWCDADGELEGPVTSKSWTVHGQAVTMRLPPPDQRQPTE